MIIPQNPNPTPRRFGVSMAEAVAVILLGILFARIALGLFGTPA
jgi:hypothetical protein